jgi:hypothetical protein
MKKEMEEIIQKINSEKETKMERNGQRQTEQETMTGVCRQAYTCVGSSPLYSF